jgi:Uma2 family endonuclease
MSEALAWNDALPPDGTVMSTSEYFQTVETRQVHELWYGVLRVAESPTSWHQDLAFEVAVAIRHHARLHDLGKVWMAPLDVILDHARSVVVQPDVLYVARERLDIVSDKVRGAPDLVVEILSPRPRVGSSAERVGCFARCGVRECWLVEQRLRTVEVLTFQDGRVASRMKVGLADPIPSAVLPGLAFPLGDPDL